MQDDRVARESGARVKTGETFPTSGHWKPSCGSREQLAHRALLQTAGEAAPGCPWYCGVEGVLVTQVDAGPPKARPRFSTAKMERPATTWTLVKPLN